MVRAWLLRFRFVLIDYRYRSFEYHENVASFDAAGRAHCHCDVAVVAALVVGVVVFVVVIVVVFIVVVLVVVLFILAVMCVLFLPA